MHTRHYIAAYIIEAAKRQEDGAPRLLLPRLWVTLLHQSKALLDSQTGNRLDSPEINIVADCGAASNSDQFCGEQVREASNKDVFDNDGPLDLPLGARIKKLEFGSAK